MAHLSYIVNTMAADDLGTQGVRASAAIVWPSHPGIFQLKHQINKNTRATKYMQYRLSKTTKSDSMPQYAKLIAAWSYKAKAIWFNIGSVNGLLPDGTKPLPEPFTYHQ